MADSESAAPAKPILEVSIITGLTFLVNTHWAKSPHKADLITAVPAVGGTIAYLLRRLGKYLRYRELREIEADSLREAQAKRAQAGLSSAEIKRLDKEISSRQQTLEQLRRDNLIF